MSMRLATFAVIAVTLIAVTFVIVINFGQPETEHISAPDSDGDEIPDDEDFFDGGNGGVRIAISYFKGTCGNLFAPCDPKFEIAMDLNGNGKYDAKSSRGFQDKNELYSPLQYTADPRDERTSVVVEIRIWDTDGIFGPDQMDYTDGSAKWTSFVVDLTNPNPQSWTFQGSDVPYCTISVMAEVVSVP